MLKFNEMSDGFRGQSQYFTEKAGKWSEWSRIYRILAPNSSFELFVRRYEPTKTVISNNYKIKLKITIKTKLLWAEKNGYFQQLQNQEGAL